MPKGISFEGDKEILENLIKSVKVMAKTTNEALIEIGERGVGILDRNTPVDKGRLRQSMSYTISGKVTAPLGGTGDDILRKSNNDDEVVIGTNVIYAEPVEFKSKNGSAGYMFRSYKQLVPIAKKVLGKFIKTRFR